MITDVVAALLARASRLQRWLIGRTCKAHFKTLSPDDPDSDPGFFDAVFGRPTGSACIDGVDVRKYVHFVCSRWPVRCHRCPRFQAHRHAFEAQKHWQQEQALDAGFVTRCPTQLVDRHREGAEVHDLNAPHSAQGREVRDHADAKPNAIVAPRPPCVENAQHCANHGDCQRAPTEQFFHVQVPTLQLDDINDPRLPHLIASANDGSGSPLDLVGLKVEPASAPPAPPNRAQRVATWLRERIVVWLAALAIAILLGAAPVIEDGAEVVAADVQDAQAQAVADAQLARSEP